MNPETSSKDREFKAPTTGGEAWRKVEATKNLELTGRTMGGLNELGTPEQIQEIKRQQEQDEKDNAAARAKKYEIPSEVKKGTIDMVWYDLKNSLTTNQEGLDKTTGPEHIRSFQRLEKLKLEQQILNVNMYTSNEQGRTTTLPILDVYDRLQKLIELWESEDNPDLNERDLAAARALQDMIMREASRTQDNI